jgi:hypothetical protein
MANQKSPATSTQIRTLYSNGISCLTIKFFNTNLSFGFQPFSGKDQNGFNQFNKDKTITTTVNYEGAATLWKTGQDILDGKINKCNVVIQCAGGTVLILERRLNDNQLETWCTINKNGEIIPFRFNSYIRDIEENGQMIKQQIEAGLLVFIKTINGYLEGINADRHLDKLTDDYVKSLGDKANNQQFQTNSGYQKKPYNRPYSPNYKKNYNNYNNNRNNNQTYSLREEWETQNNQQNMSSYNIE